MNMQSGEMDIFNLLHLMRKMSQVRDGITADIIVSIIKPSTWTISEFKEKENDLNNLREIKRIGNEANFYLTKQVFIYGIFLDPIYASPG